MLHICSFPTDFNTTGRVSASSCAQVYNETLSQAISFNIPIPDNWQFSLLLQKENVWDAFVLLSLLEDFHQRNHILDLPHDGDQKLRFNTAMQQRNNRIQMYGQPEVPHRCKKCTRYYDSGGEIGI